MALNAAAEAINLVASADYAGMLPADVSARGGGSARGAGGPRGAPAGADDGAGGDPPAQLAQTAIKKGKDTIMINMEIKFPKKEKKVKEKATKKVGSILSGMFTDQKFPEPLYFQNVDCVAIPFLFSKKECQHVIDFAEASEFRNQHRYRAMNFAWLGLVAVGLNDVVRIHKYVQGNVFGRHIDQTVQRADGKVSRYSLRIYLNGSDGEFEGS